MDEIIKTIDSLKWWQFSLACIYALMVIYSPITAIRVVIISAVILAIVSRIF